MPKKNEDAPVNATGAAVAGTGDDAQAWKKKKKKKKKDMYDGKTMDQLHDLIKQGKSADEIAKLMKLDKDTIKALMEAKFAPRMIDKLRKEYGTIDKMTIKQGEKLKNMVDKYPTDVLKQLADEDIKWLSMFAALKLGKMARG